MKAQKILSSLYNFAEIMIFSRVSISIFTVFAGYYVLSI